MIKRGWFAVAMLWPTLVWSADVLRNRDTVAILGDSITEQRMYSVDIETYLLTCKPRQNLRVDQFGWSGETAPAFADRIVSDVLPLHPTVATTCYGMNDGHYTALTPQTTDAFRTAMTDVLNKLRAGGVRTVVVGGPGCVDPHWFKKPGVTAEEYNHTLSALSDVDRQLAAERHLPFADVFGEMTKVMTAAKSKYGDDFAFGGRDGIHPGAAGHLVMAYAFLKAMGCDGNIGTITLDMTGNGNQNTASEGHRILSSHDGTVEIESRRYPYCFTGDGKSATSDRSVVDLMPFDPDLNRFVLVVKNLGPGNVRVTWGSASKDFTAEALTRGINLAAEFPDANPFAAAFADVEQAVTAQQIFETMLTKSLLHNEDALKKASPAAQPQVDAFIGSAMKLDDTLFQEAAQKAQTPVHHTIKIEPVP